MPRKTLKQKQKSQIRGLKQIVGHQHQILMQEHQEAGLVINQETRRMQSIGMAHGTMAALIQAKNTFDKSSEEFLSFEKVCQGRIAQCMVALVESGLSADEANARILQGH